MKLYREGLQKALKAKGLNERKLGEMLGINCMRKVIMYNALTIETANRIAELIGCNVSQIISTPYLDRIRKGAERNGIYGYSGTQKNVCR